MQPKLAITEAVCIEMQDLPEHDAVAFQITAHNRDRVQHEINRLMTEAETRPNCIAEFRHPTQTTTGEWMARGYVTKPHWTEP